MPRLSVIQPKEIRKIVVEISDEDVSFDIDTNAFTIGWERRFRRAANSGDISAVSTEFFSLVKGWDITDDDDKVLPLDESAFDMLSLATFVAMSDLITEALDPNDLVPTKK